MAVSNYHRSADRFGPGAAYEEPSPRDGRTFKLLAGLAALLAVAAVAWVAWIAYDEGVRVGTVKTVPVIRASAGDVKRKPADAGGLVVPHQDKLVFSRLAPGQSDAPIERLLPLPEAPIALPVTDSDKPPAGKSLGAAPQAPETEVATALTPNLVGPGPAEKLPPESDAAPSPAPKTQPPAAVATAPPPAPPVDPAEIIAATPPAAATPLDPPDAPPPVAAVTPPVDAGDAWRIQLISLSSLEDAKRVWGRLKKSNDDLLGGLELQVQTAKLASGTFYRVQAGPLPNRAAAASLCGTLKSRKQDCLVVAP